MSRSASTTCSTGKRLNGTTVASIPASTSPRPIASAMVAVLPYIDSYTTNARMLFALRSSDVSTA
jgi:hypothetical protein